MIKTITRYTLVLGLGLLPLVGAQPWSGPGSTDARQTFMLNRMGDYLKLTEDQKTRITAIQAKHAEEIKTKTQAADDARKAFLDAAAEGNATAPKLKPLYQTKSDRSFELMLAIQTMQDEIRTVLTPEQRAEADKYRAFSQGMRGGRRGGGHGVGMGMGMGL
jgi:Spy/CpxP family protein refolding chaperone